MKQAIPPRRSRGRGNPRVRQQSNVRNQQMDSNGPVGRLRGTPQQILDRYSILARDASSVGDMVLAENLWQHAEHYSRMLNATQSQQQQQHPQNGQRFGNDPDETFDYDDLDDGGNDVGKYQSSRPEARLEPPEAPPEQRESRPDLRESRPEQRESRPEQRESRPEQRESRPEQRESRPEQRESRPEPIVLRPNPEPVASVDLGEADQPASPRVWSATDVKPATDEVMSAPNPAESEQRPPRRRRRTRFPRQTEGSEPSDSDAPVPLTLPKDPSPAALVDLLTRVEEADQRTTRRTDESSD